MHRLFIFIACLTVPAYSHSDGASEIICTNNLSPEHGVSAANSAAPYEYYDVRQDEDGKVSLNIGGSHGFLGFAVQARNAHDEPVGKFIIVDDERSQTLTCSNPGDTLTHKKIPTTNPIVHITFDWVPNGYKGKVNFVATVVENFSTFWTRGLTMEMEV